jgi:hypothetical protein
MGIKRFVLCLLILLVPACGVHVTSDPVQVKHTVVIDIAGIVDHCEAVCDGSTACFEDCARRFFDLFSDTELCGAAGACLQ